MINSGFSLKERYQLLSGTLSKVLTKNEIQRSIILEILYSSLLGYQRRICADLLQS